MAPVEEMIKIDFVSLFVSILIILAGLKVVFSLFEWFCKKFGIELKSQRERREDHEMIRANTQRLAELQAQHNEDDKKIKEDLSKFTQEIRDSVIQTREQMEQFRENRVSDRAQSFKIQKELQDSQDRIRDSLNNLSDRLSEMKAATDQRFADNEIKQNKRVQAELKDQISKIYIKCNDTKQISDMEIEVLEGLISTYEDYGGQNSFVHSVVQKEMYTWERVNPD